MKVKKAKVVEPLKLDFGAGNSPQPGYKSVDFYADKPDYKIDLFKFPLPWKDGSVDEIYASHFVEHIPREKRWPFFEECWRILKLEGVMNIIVPSFKSERAYGDMTHEMPPVVPFFFFYLNKSWREANKLTHGKYNIKCNFEHACGTTGLNPPFNMKADDVKQFSAIHYWEVCGDTWATIRKKPM